METTSTTTTAVSLSRVDRRAALWLFVFLSVLYAGVTRGHFGGTDEIAVYQMTRSMWERGDLTVGNINNTFTGRDGQRYSQYNIAQAVLSLPLYAIGKTVRQVLEGAGASDAQRLFSGPQLGREPSRWGGDVEIFFVNLFNAFATSLLCVVFFLGSRLLGAHRRYAILAALLIGLTTFPASFSIGFLRHTAEAVLLLAAVVLLMADARRPSDQMRLFAGLTMALMLHMRLASAISWPLLGLYLLWNVWSRRPNTPAVRYWWRQLGPFSMSLLLGLGGYFALAQYRFGSWMGKYNNEGFNTPLADGLYAFLLSPGGSIFLFSPLLFLAPWLLRHQWRSRSSDTVLITTLALSYLCFFGMYTMWHGLWSALGPRYTVPIHALLLLPLAPWMEQVGRRALWVVTPLAIWGACTQLLSILVSFSFVYHHENYVDYEPQYGFLLSWSDAPIFAHISALFAGDHRVHTWVVDVFRQVSPSYGMMLLATLMLLLAYCGRRLWLTVQNEDDS